MINLFYDCYCVLNKVYAEKAYIKQALAETPIEEKNRAATVKICYGVLDKDTELSYYITSLTHKSPKLPVRTILKISMYCIKYLGKKDYAVIKNAVELTKKLGKGGASGFVNAFLRSFDATEIPLPTETVKGLSVKYSYPEFAVKELVGFYGKDKAESIISSFAPPVTLAFYAHDGKKYLSDLNADYSATPFDNVFNVKKFVRNADYDKGVYTYQSLGSVAICETVEKCEKLLDCCAAPGGKSVRLSYKCKSVTSWDIHPHRTELIESYKRRMGRENITAECRDAKVFYPEYTEVFDAVLVDAPCSGTGVIWDNPDIKLNRTEADVAALNEEQSAILATVRKYVKSGGCLYYSTCSVLPRENMLIADRFLKTFDDFTEEKIESPLPHEKSEHGVSFLPALTEGLGFYVVKFRKK